MMKIRTRLLATVCAALVSAVAIDLGLPRTALGVEPTYTGFLSSTALGGYDPVAYFIDRKSVKGSDEYALEWKGVRWRFAGVEHLETFRADPEKFASRYGGYCAYAVAHGATAPGDPQVWKVFDGRLYLNVSKGIQVEWEKNIPGYIHQADENWPKLLAGD